MINIETNIDVPKEFSEGKYIDGLSAEKIVSISVELEDPDYIFPVKVKLTQHGKSKNYHIMSNDKFIINHKFNVSVYAKEFNDMLPLTISYKGMIYKLSETKNGKLILTK